VLVDREARLPGLVQREREIRARVEVAEAASDPVRDAREDPRARYEALLDAARDLRNLGELRVALGWHLIDGGQARDEPEPNLAAATGKLEEAHSLVEAEFPYDYGLRASTQGALAVDRARRRQWKDSDGELKATNELFDLAVRDAHGSGDPEHAEQLRAIQSSCWVSVTEVMVDQGWTTQAVARMESLRDQPWSIFYEDQQRFERVWGIARLRTGQLSAEEFRGGMKHVADNFADGGLLHQAVATRLFTVAELFDVGEVAAGRRLLAAATADARYRRFRDDRMLGNALWLGALAPAAKAAPDRTPAPPARHGRTRRRMGRALPYLDRAGAPEAGVLLDSLSERDPFRPSLPLQRFWYLLEGR